MNIGLKIKKIREFKGYSQEFMASRLNVSQAAYSKIESRKLVHMLRVMSIADILEITPLQLLNFDETRLIKEEIKLSPNFEHKDFKTQGSERERERESYL